MGELQNIIIAVLLVGIVAVGISAFTTNVDALYGTGQLENVSFIEKTTNISQKASEIRTTVSSGTLEQTWLIPMKGAWASIKIIFSFPDIINALVSDIASFLKVDAFVVLTVSAIIAIIVAFAVIHIIFKVRA